MSVRGGAALYTPEMLALAVELASWPLDPAAPHQGQARSPTCGSTIAMSIAGDQIVCAVGLRVAACAVGQAAAALFVRSAAGRSAGDIRASRDGIAAWLAGEGAMPDWPGLEILAAVPAYPARHGALLLPWNAALDALSKDAPPG